MTLFLITSNTTAMKKLGKVYATLLSYGVPNAKKKYENLWKLTHPQYCIIEKAD